MIFNTYRLYDPQNDRIVISCDVIFTAKIGLGSESSVRADKLTIERAADRIGFDFSSAETSGLGESLKSNTNGCPGNNLQQNGCANSAMSTSGSDGNLVTPPTNTNTNKTTMSSDLASTDAPHPALEPEIATMRTNEQSEATASDSSEQTRSAQSLSIVAESVDDNRIEKRSGQSDHCRGQLEPTAGRPT